MAQVYYWSDLVHETRKLFPETNLNTLLLAEENLGLLVREVARAQDLTLSEAAEMAALRLPDFTPEMRPVEDQRLSA